MRDEKVLYAIVIGRKHKHTRYITTCPFIDTSNFTSSEMPLAVYQDYSRARAARQTVLRLSGHKDVYIVRYTEKK